MFDDPLFLAAAAAAIFSIGFLLLLGAERPQRISPSSATFLSEQLTLPAQFQQRVEEPALPSRDLVLQQERPAQVRRVAEGRRSSSRTIQVSEEQRSFAVDGRVRRLRPRRSSDQALLEPTMPAAS